MTYSYSFQPNGRWFVFCIETGETLFSDLVSAGTARTAVARYIA